MLHQRVAERSETAVATGRLLSVNLPCPGVDLRDFLTFSRGTPRFALEQRCGGPAVAGAGITAELVAWGDRFTSIEGQTRTLFESALVDGDGPAGCQPRLFGGFAFQDDFVPDNTWTIWSPAWFVLPHYQFALIDGESWLTLNVQVPADDNVAETLFDLRHALQDRCHELQSHARQWSERPQARLRTLEYPMARATWDDMISTASGRIADGELQKVVLSRVAEARFDRPPDTELTLERLRRSYDNCWRFLLEPRPGHAFFGATPELLADVQGRNMKSMALAGSVARGATRDEDETLARQMMADSKEQHEHALVVKTMSRRLASMGETKAPEVPGALKLANIQHLHTPLYCRLNKSGGTLSLVKLLHPSPALGGTPRTAALKLISELEPVPRGWYAGPVGCLTMQLDGTFVVAIRSAICQERRMWLYAGAGIVAGSVAQREWEESELKFRPVLAAMGLQEGQPD